MPALHREPGEGQDEVKNLAGQQAVPFLSPAKRLVLVLAAAAIAGLDQYTKHFFQGLVRAHGGHIEVAPFLNLVEVHNTGAAFGILASAQPYLEMASLLLCAILFVAIRFYKKLDMALGVPLALLLGGGAGNAVDRVWQGKVFDFVDLHAAGWHWPAFNVADMAITAGAVLLLWQVFASGQQED